MDYTLAGEYDAVSVSDEVSRVNYVEVEQETKFQNLKRLVLSMADMAVDMTSRIALKHTEVL